MDAGLVDEQELEREAQDDHLPDGSHLDDHLKESVDAGNWNELTRDHHDRADAVEKHIVEPESFLVCVDLVIECGVVCAAICCRVHCEINRDQQCRLHAD